MGQTLWPGDKWRCTACLEDSLPGKDLISKSLNQSIQYANETRRAFALEAAGMNGEACRDRAEWARMMAVEIKNQGTHRTNTVAYSNGEAVGDSAEQGSHDVMAVPDLAAVEASLDRSRLLLQTGAAAMALDAANSIEAGNSLERMLAHQLAVAHRQVMEQMSQVAYERDAVAQAKRLNAAARCMRVYQQGVLTLNKLKNGGQQRIMVQYVSVTDGSQAVIGNIMGVKRNKD